MPATGGHVPRALLAQLAPSPGSPEANARRAAEIITAGDADLVIFPELYLSGYHLKRVGETAVALGSAAIGAIRAAAEASETAAVVGFAELAGSRALRADGTIAAQAGDDAEELLAFDLPEREGTDDRVDYLRQLRDDMGVRAPTTVTGGSG